MSIQSIGSSGFGFTQSAATTQRPAAPLGSSNIADSVQEDARPTTTNQATVEQRKSVEDAAKSIEKFVSLANNNLSFSIDGDTDKLVVKVMDRSTNEVIRQFPSEELLQLSKSLDKLQGLLLKSSA